MNRFFQMSTGYHSGVHVFLVAGVGIFPHYHERNSVLLYKYILYEQLKWLLTEICNYSTNGNKFLIG